MTIIMARRRRTPTMKTVVTPSNFLKTSFKDLCFKVNFLFRRYHDKERSRSPETVVTSAPTFKNDDAKRTISVKNTVKPVSSASGSRAPKKIDMGAAFNYGKSSDLGINSPTHRNTHSENLFGDEPPVVKKTPEKSSNEIIEDIFSSASTSRDQLDDFDPRSGEVTADFGDFTSAFGNNQTASEAPLESSNEFADFSSAFVSPPTSFASAPAPATSNLLVNTDLFGNSVITNAFESTMGGNHKKDLLSDFGDLNLNANQGELFWIVET
jgi:hypothetical protein